MSTTLNVEPHRPNHRKTKSRQNSRGFTQFRQMCPVIFAALQALLPPPTRPRQAKQTSTQREVWWHPAAQIPREGSTFPGNSEARQRRTGTLSTTKCPQKEDANVRFSSGIHSNIKKIKRHRAQMTLEMRVNLVFVFILMNFRLALSFQHICVKERFIRLAGEGFRSCV